MTTKKNKSKKQSSNILKEINQANQSKPSSEANPTSDQDSSTTIKKSKFAFKLKKPSFKLGFGKKTKIGLTIFLIPIILLTIAALATIPPLLKIKQTIAQTETTARETYQALKEQNLPLASEKLLATRQSFNIINSNYNKLFWYKFTPLRPYYLDGQRILISADSGLNAGETLLEAVTPYADVLGFSGEGTFTGGTAEDRIVKIIETMGEVAPALDQVSSDLQTIDAQLSQINPNRYPFEIRGQQAPDLIEQAQDMTSFAADTIGDIKPLLEVIPSVAGLEEPKKYLVLFQNDAELRPTGGFMTAYGVLRVEKGRVNQEKSDDIYELDNKFKSNLTPPAPIKKYLPLVYNWHLRDMNLSPDFQVSMDTFLEHYYTVPGEADDLDGVIAIDTKILTDLVRLLGPVDVPGFGTFSADIDERCDCPQVIYELEDISTRPVAYIRDDRKGFLGPMMQTIIIKAYGAPPAVWPTLFKTMIDDIAQKHAIFYMFDEQANQAAEGVNVAGRILDYDGDYFQITDTNFGGAKSDLFITQEVEHQITVHSDKVQHEATITYKNPAKGSNCNLEAGQLCLNGTYRDYVRFYLPKGAELVEALGLEEGSTETSEDLGKTVIEGFFTFQPESQAKIKLTYTVPYQPQNEYKLFIQKQPGRKNPNYTVIFNGVDKKEFELKTDKEVVFEL